MTATSSNPARECQPGIERIPTDYQRDKLWERSEWLRVPLLNSIPYLVLVCMWGTR